MQYYADPDFATVPVEGLLSKSYADERRTLVDPDQAALAVSPGDPSAFAEGPVAAAAAAAAATAARGAAKASFKPAPATGGGSERGLRGAPVRESLESKYGGDTVYLTVADGDGMMVRHL